MQSTNTPDYAHLGVDETFAQLKSSINGLANSEAELRIQRFGFNEVAEKKRSPVVEFLSRYWGPMPWLLELTILLSYLIGDYLEVGIIFSLLTINVIIGYHHSRSSQKALEFLKKRLAPKAKALREGKWTIMDAKELVPGDIVQLGLGDLVPADVKIVDGGLSVDQSALTGESLPVSVGQVAVVYSSSIVKRGEAKALVFNTGPNTFFGKTAELVRIAKPTSHQQQIMSAIIKYSMYVAIAALALVLVEATLTQALDPLNIVRFALIFLMGAVPVALPAVFAIVLAVGAMQLAKGGALVTRLDSIEDAASMDLLCLDKTGTITQNKLSATDPLPFNGFTQEDVITTASLASKEEIGDPIDQAVIDFAKTMRTNLAQYKQISFVPFDPMTKRSEAVVEQNGNRFTVMKGAPQIVLPLCQQLNQTIRKEVDRALEELWQKGYRTLVVAKSEDSDPKSLRFVGLLPIADPPRPDCAADD